MKPLWWLSSVWIVSPASSEKVLSLDHALGAQAVAGIRELVPTYRSPMIHYDPLVLRRAELIAIVDDIFEAGGGERPIGPARLWTFPCCYEADFAEDLAEVAQELGLSQERVVELHGTATYRLAMYGFAPGFSYLSGLPAELAVSRRPGGVLRKGN